MMVQLGSLVGKQEQARVLVEKFEQLKLAIHEEVTTWHDRPVVYFEEWYDPLISGIQWVSEIISLAGGKDAFEENALQSLARNRIIDDTDKVIQKNPDIILVSWCGKMFKKDKMVSRPGWRAISAVKNDELYEIPSEIILQPGPAALFEGLPMIHNILKKFRSND